MATHRISKQTEERLAAYAHKRYEEGKLPTVLGYTVDSLVSALLKEAGF